MSATRRTCCGRSTTQADGADGFVSIEVEPDLADDTAGTLERARHLWQRVGRPNAFVKIPATAAGLPAIEDAIAEGININITLMFSVDVYRDVARAYIAGLRRRLERGEDVTAGGIGRQLLRQSGGHQGRQAAWTRSGPMRPWPCGGRPPSPTRSSPTRRSRRSSAARSSPSCAAAGARVQRCLWASTSTKNPDYRDVLYVEELIGPMTVNTMPIETIEAFLDHGKLERTLDQDVAGAHTTLRLLEEQGISMRQVTDELIDEGVAAFGKSFDDLIAAIDSQRKALAPA